MNTLDKLASSIHHLISKMAPLFLLFGLAGSAQAAPQGPRRATLSPHAVSRPALHLWHRLVRQNGGKRSAALTVRWRGMLTRSFPQLLSRQVNLSKKKRAQNLDPSFRGTHPMFKRLVRAGWYEKTAQINALQKAANALRKNRKISRKLPLSEVEILSFDLEATSGRSGKFDKKRGRFINGWDEVMQFGYTVQKGGKVIERGSIPIRPDTFIPKAVAKLTGLDEHKLASAPHFEAVAGKILEVMKGRVLLGQSAIQKDWSWLQSNFARLGVTLPSPKGLILDTYLLSFNHFPQGSGVDAMSRHFGVKAAPGHLHDARVDAELTGGIFSALMRQDKAHTLGDAFRLQNAGYAIQHTPHRARK